MQLHSLKANTRQPAGKGGARNVRALSKVPAVVYGGGGSVLHVAVDSRQFAVVVHGRGGEHAIVQLEMEDQPDLNTPALVKDVQHDPIRGHILHADFLRIRLDERIVTSVPVHVEGHAAGVIEGGVIDHHLREVEVECLALDVPEELVVDVTELNMGDSIHVGQLEAPDNVQILTPEERTVVSVLAPRVVKEEAAEAEEVPEGEEGAEKEPEVIGEKKEEEQPSSS